MMMYLKLISIISIFSGKDDRKQIKSEDKWVPCGKKRRTEIFTKEKVLIVGDVNGKNDRFLSKIDCWWLTVKMIGG